MEKERTLPVTEARKELYSLVKACEGRALTFVLTAKGRAVARLLSEEEYESIMETIQVLSDKQQVERLLSALKHMKRGKLYTHEDVFGRYQPRS